MKNLKIVIVAIMLFALLVGTGAALPPPPPVNQNIGYAPADASYATLTTDNCKGCHGATTGADIHHYMKAKSNTVLGCYDCHPMVGVAPSRTMYIEKQCTSCHTANNTAFAMQPSGVVNLTQLRPPGRPHHNTTKNSSSNVLMPVAGQAAARHCVFCHGTSLIANYDDGHAYPNYDASMITPFADYKINKTVSGDGRVWGGCMSCHDNGSTGMPGVPLIETNEGTHHTVRGSTTTGGYTTFGLTCTNCHVGNVSRLRTAPTLGAYYLTIKFATAYPNYVSMFQWDTASSHSELRNNTLMAAGDMVNGTGCQQCHSLMSLHNIQDNAAVTIPGNVPGFGHIGNNSDCDGCHKGWAGATENPFASEISIKLNSVSPDKLTYGTAADITIGGGNFVQDGYTTTVLVDGADLAYKSITDTQIVATIPANTAAGAHSVQVKKGAVTSGMYMFMVPSPSTITSATLTSGVLTITGTGFGTAAQQAVTINKAGGIILPSDSITSWTDTQIVAASADAVVGDTLTVTSAGEATATITGGAVVTPTPTATPPVVDSVTVVSPNGGNSFKRGTTQTITWSNAGASQAANVKIELLKGTSATVLKSSTPNSGTYSWKISSSQSVAANYKIRITSVSHTPSYTDSSNAVFSITK